MVLAIIGLDDAGLLREFDEHAEIGAGDEGERRMSKAVLASFMRHKALAHGDAEVQTNLECPAASCDRQTWRPRATRSAHSQHAAAESRGDGTRRCGGTWRRTRRRTMCAA